MACVFREDSAEGRHVSLTLKHTVCSKFAQAEAPAPPHKTDLAATAPHFGPAIYKAKSYLLGRAERRGGSTWLGQADVYTQNILLGTALLCRHGWHF